MKQMRNDGTTLIIVSHNMNQIYEMCNKAIWLNKGKVVRQGDAKEVCDEYLETIEAKKAKEKAESKKTTG